MRPPELSNAETAWRELTVRCTGFVIPEGELTNPAKSIGSATILRSRTDRIFYLTARHVGEDVRQGQLWFGYHGCRNAIKTGVAGVLLHPNADVDVAILVLKTKDQEELRPQARDARDVATTSDLDPDDGLLIAGHPRDLAKLDLTAKTHNFTTLVYGCTAATPQYDAAGRFRLSWGSEERKLGMAVPPAPHGVSGGGLWRHRHVEQAVWNITAATKLVGVQSAWEDSNGIALVEPVERWYEWFAESVERLDSGHFAAQEAG